jgi:hypothetical protein
MSEDDLQRLVAALKALADASRLRILGILAAGERTGGELAELCELRASTVSHHLTRLRELGLVTVRAEGSSKVYGLDADALASLQGGLVPESLAERVPEAQPGSFAAKVLEAFVDGTTLTKIPSSRKKREVILDWLAHDFEVGETVSEAVVNERIQRHHWDSATLRRELVGGGWMTRDAGRYTRVR